MAHYYIKTLLLTICIRRVEAPSKDEFELVQTNQVLQTLINDLNLLCGFINNKTPNFYIAWPKSLVTKNF